MSDKKIIDISRKLTEKKGRDDVKKSYNEKYEPNNVSELNYELNWKQDTLDYINYISNELTDLCNAYQDSAHQLLGTQLFQQILDIDYIRELTSSDEENLPQRLLTLKSISKDTILDIFENEISASKSILHLAYICHSARMYKADITYLPSKGVDYTHDRLDFIKKQLMSEREHAADYLRGAMDELIEQESPGADTAPSLIAALRNIQPYVSINIHPTLKISRDDMSFFVHIAACVNDSSLPTFHYTFIDHKDHKIYRQTQNRWHFDYRGFGWNAEPIDDIVAHFIQSI